MLSESIASTARALAGRSLVLLAVIASGALAGCSSLRDQIVRGAFTSAGEYANPPGDPETAFAQHTRNIYSYRYRFDRMLIVDTTEGLVLIDPMNADLTARAAELLRQRFPGKRVHTLIYSHYHLDHVRGGQVFQPQHVVVHEKALEYWKDLDTTGVVAPTETIRGDQTRSIGGVTFQLVYLGLSHTDTLYTFYFPEEKLVYTPDLGLVKAWMTPGPFNTYQPGYLRAMERVAALDFAIFIPSHAREVGTKQDFLDATAMMKDLRQSMVSSLQHHDAQSTEGLSQVFDEVYPEWKRKYGHLHGFDQVAGLTLIREAAGVYLGY